MEIQMFNFWYFFWIALASGVFVGLYLLLRNRDPKLQKTVLLCILLAGLALHFFKVLFPPYSLDEGRMIRDIWFINICGANILLFPFIFISRSKILKDYMFYIGVLSGIIALVLPLEPIDKVDQASEVLDIIRFYIHHSILVIVPLLMVLLGLHKLSYRRTPAVPACLLVVMLFIMLNQVLASEFGFVPLRGDGMFDIGYKNTSYIWGPEGTIGTLLARLCPKVFKTVPAGVYAGEEKYLPWLWLVVPAFVILTPLCFAISMIFDFKTLKLDISRLVCFVKERKLKK